MVPLTTSVHPGASVNSCEPTTIVAEVHRYFAMARFALRHHKDTSQIKNISVFYSRYFRCSASQLLFYF